MGVFFAYSLQSAICLAAFYLFYKVLLSRETFHRFNRIVILSMLVLAFVIPIALTCHSSGLATGTSSGNHYTPTVELEGLSVEGFLTDENATNQTEKRHLAMLLLVYLIGCTACLIHVILSIARILRIINSGKCICDENGVKIIISEDETISPFSWMRYIILSKTDYEEAGDTIIAHEKAHISQHHTYDLVISQLCVILQWFNPTAWLLYQEIQNIHEYEADERVIRQGIDARQYQLLLIKKAVGTRLYSMANSFNHSNLKKRITMMLQKKSNAWARLKYAFVLPLAATTVIVFAHPEISEQFEPISNAKINHLALETSTNEVKNPLAADIPETQPSLVMTVPEDSIYRTAEYMPAFPGGETALLKYIADHIIYPKEAAEKGIQGRVACTFTVNKDGSISDVRVVRPSTPMLDEEAIRVVKTLPKFKPGTVGGKVVRVMYSIPVNFRLSAPPAPKLPEQSTSADKDENNLDYVFVTVEKMPQFPGGEKALLDHIAANIKYPEDAAKEKVQGRVSCSFTVNANGSVSDVVIVRSQDPRLDKEAIRVISALPKFTPGEMKGKPVRVKYSIPVNFRLPEQTTNHTN